MEEHGTLAEGAREGALSIEDESKGGGWGNSTEESDIDSMQNGIGERVSDSVNYSMLDDVEGTIPDDTDSTISDGGVNNPETNTP